MGGGFGVWYGNEVSGMRVGRVYQHTLNTRKLEAGDVSKRPPETRSRHAHARRDRDTQWCGIGNTIENCLRNEKEKTFKSNNYS